MCLFSVKNSWVFCGLDWLVSLWLVVFHFLFFAFRCSNRFVISALRCLVFAVSTE